MSTRYCQNFKKLLVKDDDDKVLVGRARCKQWTCPYCAQINAKMWRYRIYTGSESLGIDTWSFFTLTCPGWCKEPRAQWRMLSAEWSKLRKRLKRKFGAFHYVRVFERGTSGDGEHRVHCHVMASFWFDDIKHRKSKDGTKTPYSPYLRKQIETTRLGYIHHAENLRTVPGACNYITKYVTKVEGAELPRGCRRMQASQGFPKNEREGSEGWVMYSDIHYWEWVRWALQQGKPVIDLATNQPLSSDQFLDTMVWRGSTPAGL